MSNKIPTAEVVINYLIPNAKNLMTARQYENALDVVRKHGKYYVEAALKSAANKAKIIDDPNSYTGNTGSEYPADKIVSVESILSAYPLTNIQ